MLERTAFTPPQRAKIDAALAERRRQIDARVAEQSSLAIELRDRLDDPAGLSDFNRVIQLRQSARPVLPENVLLEQLMRAGAISAGLRAKMDRAVRDYDVARREGWQAEHEQDVMRVALQVTGEKLADMSYETIESLRRQTERLAELLATALERVSLQGPVRARLEQIAAEPLPDSRANGSRSGDRTMRVRAIIEADLDDSGRQAMFEAVREE